MFLIDVVSVAPLPERRLMLVFANGRQGVVAIDAVVDAYTGVFEPLLDAEYFAQAQVDPELGTVVWPNGADFCPDVLYAHATQQVARLQDWAA